jgi:hypothetical protein
MREIRQLKVSGVGIWAVCRDEQFEPILEDRPREKRWVVFSPANEAKSQGAFVNSMEDMLAVAKANLQFHRRVGATKATEHFG